LDRVRRITPLLTLGEARVRLNVSESTLYRLRRHGAISDVRVGKRGIRIGPASVERYIRVGFQKRGIGG
jgi:excisionase family DNA binding protein